MPQAASLVVNSYAARHRAAKITLKDWQPIKTTPDEVRSEHAPLNFSIYPETYNGRWGTRPIVDLVFEASRGPGVIRKLRDVCRIHFHSPGTSPTSSCRVMAKTPPGGFLFLVRYLRSMS